MRAMRLVSHDGRLSLAGFGLDGPRRHGVAPAISAFAQAVFLGQEPGALAGAYGSWESARSPICGTDG